MYTTTYSPEDNKLRLSSATRLDAETYARVKAAGFSWAPKQGIFVAPMWTPSRADLCMDLAGEIGDEDTSLVARAEDRAERFEGYRENRTEDARAARDGVARITDGIPLGHPILVGHHSERHARKDAEKIENGMRRAVKMWETAEYWKYRAAGALAHAKYKELPAVRARRIKGLEADIRRCIAAFTPISDQVIMQRRWSDHSEDGPKVPHVYCGPKGGRGGSWVSVDRLEAIKAGSARWIQHYEFRLVYERAMLAEAGELKLLDKKPRPKLLPMCNYRVTGGINCGNIYRRGETNNHPQAEMTQAEYTAIHADYKGSRVVDGSHRVRTAMVRHSLVCVFLTDSKVHECPSPASASAPVADEIADAPVHAYVPRVKSAEELEFAALREAARAGVQVVSAPQLFPTPAELAERMVEAAGIEPQHRVLEPSAGTGNILRAIGAGPDKEAVEVNYRLAEALVQNPPAAGNLHVKHADFLTCNGDLGKFDAVVMNPPFENAVDIKHIQHALTMLKPGGRLVAICANGPRQRAALMPLAENSGGYWEDLPAGTFEAAGTGVNTALVVIEVPR